LNTTSNLVHDNELIHARKTIVHIINSLSPSSRLKGVYIDDIVSYGESLGIYPENVIGVVQQLAKEGLLVEVSRNRFLNRFSPINIPDTAREKANRFVERTLSAELDPQSDIEHMAKLLENSHIRIAPAQLLRIKQEYQNIAQSADSSFFYQGYPSDAELGKRVRIDKRKIQGARVLLGLLNERDLKIDFDQDKLLRWLAMPKNQRKSSKEFSKELGVSYSTFKRKRALWEAYLANSQPSNRSFKP